MKEVKAYKSINLGSIAKFINGDRGKNYPSQKDFVNHGIPFVNAGHIKEGSINFESMNYISQERFDLLGSGKIQSDDILYCLRGSLGKIAIVQNIKKGAIASSLVIIRPSNELITKYLYYFLTSSLGQAEIYKHNNGSSQPNLSAKSVKEYKIPLPPLEEQKRIAAILDKADRIRRKRQEAIQLTEELARSLFLDMFGDPVTNPKGWDIVKISQIVDDIESGWSPKCDSRIAEKEEWGILKLGAITWGVFDETANKALLPETKPKPELEIKVGNLLFSRKNTYELVGASAFVHKTRSKLLLPDLIFRLKINNRVNPVYLWQALSQLSARREISRLASGSAGSMPNISKARLRTLKVSLPPLDKQKKYNRIIERYWQQQESLEKSAKESNNLFNSLLQRAFRGYL